MATTVEALRIHLGIDPASTVDTEAMTAAVAAANRTAQRYIPELTASEPWDDDVLQGATLTAARLYGRRGSVQGVAAFADIGITMLPRIDPDVRMLWRLGEYQPSVVA